MDNKPGFEQEHDSDVKDVRSSAAPKDAFAEPISSTAAASDDRQLHQPYNELEQRLGELTEALQRERADAMNLRRRHTEELAGLKSHVTADIVRKLLPVIDNVERALKHVPEDLAGNDFVKGVQGVAKQFEKALSDVGVERITTVGEVFDPQLHEAVSMEEGDGAQEVVSEELQAGYRAGDMVIRHAMVRVKMQ